jgi:hypothetical protein
MQLLQVAHPNQTYTAGFQRLQNWNICVRMILHIECDTGVCPTTVNKFMTDSKQETYFLYLTIHRKKTKLDFAIYRKHTQISQYRMTPATRMNTKYQILTI